MSTPRRPALPASPAVTEALRARKARRARLVTTVHTRGVASLDAVLELTERACRQAPLDEILASLTERIAALLSVEVCSIYLRDEESGELVLSATHGFPHEAVGVVRMRVGEGLTGFAVECLRPVSVAAATVDSRNKPFAALPEERYPALCALPLVDGGRGVGALVVQRREVRAFDRREVVLIAAMAPAVLFAIERSRSRLRAAEGAQAAPREGRRPVEILLRGAAAVPGRAVGTIAVGRARLAVPSARAADPAVERDALERAFAACAVEVATLDTWARERFAEISVSTARPEIAVARARLLALRFVLDDGRLRQRALLHVASGASAPAAVERVAREYARVLGEAADDVLRERAIELEALCGRLLHHLAALASPAAVATEPGPGAIFVAGRLTVFEAVQLARAHAAACALSAPAAASPGVEVARALGLPVVCDLKAIFRWAQDGDRAIVDGDAGTLLLNPPRTDVAALRRDRAK